MKEGLVRAVPPEAITPFISGVVIMPKDSVSGGVRITVDFRELNKWLVDHLSKQDAFRSREIDLNRNDFFHYV